MSAKSNQKIPEPYLWDIPPASFPEADKENELDPWNVLEFLRIEALLRSPQVMELFKRNSEYHEEMQKYLTLEESGQAITSYPSTLALKDKLFLDYKVVDGWQVLAGSHHRLLSPDSMKLTFTSLDEADDQKEVAAELEIFSSSSGLLNLRPLYRAEKGFSRRGCFIEKNDLEEKKDLEQMILDKDPRYLWVRIDTAYPPTRILKELKKELEERHKTQDVPPPKTGNIVAFLNPLSRWTNFQPSHPSQRPPRLGLKTWIDYFRCYDLHQNDGISCAQIAIKLYGDSKKDDQVKKACNRVGKLIRYAESNNWPPPDKFLNSK